MQPFSGGTTGRRQYRNPFGSHRAATCRRYTVSAEENRRKW